MDFLNLEEDCVYEVLVSTCNNDDTLNVNVFGMSLYEDSFVFNLYPNNTLLNIKRNGSFYVHFTSDILLYTRTVLGFVEDSFFDFVDISFFCNVTNISESIVKDSYGKNINTKIIAKPVKIIRNNDTIPIISRASNKIIELLVDYTRIEYMNIDDKKDFYEKIEDYEKFIKKTGNTKHKKAIQLIKKEIIKINPHN